MGASGSIHTHCYTDRLKMIRLGFPRPAAISAPLSTKTLPKPSSSSSSVPAADYQQPIHPSRDRSFYLGAADGSITSCRQVGSRGVHRLRRAQDLRRLPHHQDSALARRANRTQVAVQRLRDPVPEEEAGAGAGRHRGRRAAAAAAAAQEEEDQGGGRGHRGASHGRLRQGRRAQATPPDAP